MDAMQAVVDGAQFLFDGLGELYMLGVADLFVDDPLDLAFLGVALEVRHRRVGHAGPPQEAGELREIVRSHGISSHQHTIA